MLNARRVAEIMRQRLGVKGAGEGKLIAMVNATIPEALKETGRRIASDPRTRALLITDKNVAKVDITSGMGYVDLTTLYETYFAMKEFIEYGEMYLLPTAVIAAASVDTTANTLTAADQRFSQFDRVQVASSGFPDGLAATTDYWVTAASTAAGAFQLSSSIYNAQIGTAIDISTQGSGNHTVTCFESADHPLQKIAANMMAKYDRQFDSIFKYYSIQGDRLLLLPRASSGKVAFAVPSYPNNLAALPESLEAENMFLHTLQEIIEGRRAPRT